MDSERFADLSRRFAAAGTRRAALGVLAGGALAALGAAGLVDASQLVKGCKIPGQKCENEKKCCGKQHCKKGRCQCINKGGSCLVEIPQLGVALPTKALCCTAKCGRDGKCK